jgi:hypothetical protein
MKWRYKIDRVIEIMERNAENETLNESTRDLFGEIVYWLKDYRAIKEERNNDSGRNFKEV